MKLTIKTLMRAIGILSGLLGLSMLCVAPFMLYHAITERNPSMTVLMVVFPLAFGLYFIYVAYLVWFKFSPLAVRHICGALGFYLLAPVAMLFDPSRDSGTPWTAFAFLGCLVVVYFTYRLASDRLNKLLFPQSVPGDQL
jgi:hypothetical protein